MAITKIPSAGFQDNVKFRNIIINGDMSIAQRGTSFTTPTAGDYLLDRFLYQENFGATCTITQSTDVPSSVNFTNSMKIDITTAATPTGSEEFKIDYRIEGKNFSYLGFGTSSAKSLTLSFWVKSNVTGTYRVNFFNLNGTGNKIVGGTYTINSSSTWEKKTISIPADTTQATYLTNAEGFRVEFYLASGGDRTSGTLPTDWIAYDATRRASGQGVNLASSTDNEWYITGVQLEAGTSASDFEFLPVDVNLNRCERYYQIIDSVIGTAGGTTAVYAAILFPTVMRASPSISASGVMTWRDLAADFTQSSTNAALWSSFQSARGAGCSFSNLSGMTTYRPMLLVPTSGNILFSSEL